MEPAGVGVMFWEPRIARVVVSETGRASSQSTTSFAESVRLLSSVTANTTPTSAQFSGRSVLENASGLCALAFAGTRDPAQYGQRKGNSPLARRGRTAVSAARLSGTNLSPDARDAGREHPCRQMAFFSWRLRHELRAPWRPSSPSRIGARVDAASCRRASRQS